MDETRDQLLRDRERAQGKGSVNYSLEQVTHQVELRAKLLRILFEELQKVGFSSQEALTITAGQNM